MPAIHLDILSFEPKPSSPPDLRLSGKGMGKPRFCFASLPAIVSKISTQNSEPTVPFSSLFLTAKNVKVSPGTS